ncbi:Ig-like domain-containing protein, partial [Marinomonas transparens]
GNTSETVSNTVASAETEVGAPSIVLDSAGEDGIYNVAELGADGTVTATISLSDDFNADTDTLTINGETHSVTVEEMTAGAVMVEVAPEATITASITDVAGNTSTQVSATVASADTTGPTVWIDAVTDDVGSVTGTLTSGDRTDDTNLLLSGTVEAGSMVKIYDGSTELGEATVTGTNWTYTATLSDDTSYQFNAKATDAAGNESAATANFAVTAATATPEVTFIDDVGSIQGELTSGDSTDDTSLLLSGIVELGSTVKVYNGTTELGNATIEPDGTWSYIATLNNGSHYRFNVRATDAAGNEGAATSDFSVTSDTVAPLILMDVATDDVGSVTGRLTSGGTTDDTNLVLSGYTEPGSIVTLYNGNTELGEATVTGLTWTYTATLNDGVDYQFTAKATDTAGNESAGSSDFSVTVDTSGPTKAANNAIVWDSTQGGEVASLDAGDTVTITFNEEVKVVDLLLSDLTLTNNHSWGAGAMLSAVNDGGDGYADTYSVTLGTGSTAMENDKITIATGTLRDKAGNTNEEIGLQVDVDTSIVVFDLVSGTSSSHSGRTFDANVSYTLYIKVDSDSETVNLASDSKWLLGGNLGVDDKIVLVGDELGGVLGKSSELITRFDLDTTGYGYFSNMVWKGSEANAQPGSVHLRFDGSFMREYIPSFGLAWEGVDRAERQTKVDLFTGTMNLTGQHANQGETFNNVYADTLPSNVAITQPMF